MYVCMHVCMHACMYVSIYLFIPYIIIGSQPYAMLALEVTAHYKFDIYLSV